MLMKTFFILSLFAFSPNLQAADASVATSPSAAVEPTLAPTAAVVAGSEAPLLPELSGTTETLTAPVDADGDSLVAEEVGEDGLIIVKTESPDLAKLDSETLAGMADGVSSETMEVLYDSQAKQALTEVMPGAWRVNVDMLYYELAKRTLADNKDKAARQSLALAFAKDTERAKYAKDLAFEDHNADVVIKQLEGGRKSAAEELKKLAEKGNRKARLYLGMDKPLPMEGVPALPGPVVPLGASGTPSVDAGQALSPTTASPVLDAPVEASPTAK